MQLIKNNPYRTVGLLVGARAAEQNRQLSRLKKFVEAETEPDQDFSFPALGSIHRTIDSINDAASKLNLDSDKISAALFWFYAGNRITDEPAFDYLKEGNIKEAVNIWGKVSLNKEINEKNASAFFNWSNLFLNAAIPGGTNKEAYLEKGITLKLKFLESDFIQDFQKAAADETFRISKKELQLIFLNQLQSELDKNGKIPSSKFLEIINKQEFSAKTDFLKGFVNGPIKDIENQITETKAKRKNNPSDAEIYGQELYAKSIEQLNQLKNILGNSDLSYQSLADKLSTEILQCGIDFFKEFKEEDFDPGEEAMNLFKKASSIAVGNIAKQRCLENSDNLQEWIDDKPDREKHKKIGQDLEFITSKLDRFQRLSDTLANAQDLINSCKTKLDNIKKVLGQKDDLYLNICNGIVSNAQGMIVTVVNSQQNIYNYENILVTIGTSYRLMEILAKFDMGLNIRNQVRKNTDTISQIRKGFVDDLQMNLRIAQNEMDKIKEWQFLRSEQEKQNQIATQQAKINRLQTSLNKVL